MRFSIIFVLAFWALLFLAPSCKDLTYSDDPPADPWNTVLESRQVGPDHVAYAILTRAGIADAQGIVWPKDKSACTDAGDPWHCINTLFPGESVHTGKSGGDTAPDDPWDTITDKFGGETLQTGGSKSDSTHNDPWDSIGELFTVESVHTGNGSKSESDPWNTIKTNKKIGQLFNQVLERVEGQHSRGELVLLAIVIAMELESFEQLQQVFGQALGSCPGGGCTDLFLAPYIMNKKGLYLAAYIDGHRVQLESRAGMDQALFSLSSPEIRPGDLVTWYKE